MTVIQAVRRGTCRLLLTQSRGVSQTSNATSGRSVTSMSHASLCQHAPGSCILCKQTLTGLRFNTTDTSKDQKQSSPSGSTGEKESDSSGTDGGMMGERSGPSKAAVPSEKQEQEDKVEEGHVQDASTETPETAPWAS